MSTSLVRVQHKGQVTIPSRLRQQAGIAEGDMVEAIFQRGHIVLKPQLVIYRSTFPNADDEYTPAQRRVIDARLAKSAEDVKKGRTFGPFNSADEMIASMERELKKRAAAKRKSKRSR
jgi:AbrB family looped-hinge helix DNA binding protein